MSGVSGAWDGNTLALVPIQIAGTEEQMDRWLPQFGEAPLLGSFCLTEPNAGSDASSMATYAKRWATVYIDRNQVFHYPWWNLCRTLSSPRPIAVKREPGITAFLVPGMPGLSMGKVEDKMGDRASHVAEVIFDEVRIRPGPLGCGRRGFQIAMRTLDQTRMSIGAAAVGVARRAYEEALEYSKQRVQFGRPISSNQAIALCWQIWLQIEAAWDWYGGRPG